MLESLNDSFRNPKNIIWVIYRMKQLRNYKKTMGSSEDPSLVNNVDKLGLVYWGLTLWRRNFLLNFSTPSISNVINTKTKKVSIMK